MPRRPAPLRLLAALAAALAGAVLLGFAVLRTAPRATADAERPSFVLILADDLDTQLGSMRFMPRVRELLAAQGTTFSRAFVPISLCCPSRASILTGLYPHNHRVYHNRGPQGGFKRFRGLGREEATIATALDAGGYRTAYLGKYLNGYPVGAGPEYVPPGWDEWAVPTSNAGYEGFDYQLNENGRLVSYGSAPQDYLTDVIAARAARSIRRAAAAGEPFFVYLAPFTPHKPATPAPRHAGLFATRRAPRAPSFDEADVRDKPAHVQALRRLSAREVAEIDELYRERLRSLRAIDDMVARLVAALEEAGALERTWFVFTSDNGFHMGQHRMRPGKATAYEEDVRVPLLMRGPGVPAGRVVDALASTLDLAPTFAELAGVALAAEPDGRSLVPLLGAAPPPADWRRVLLFEQFPPSGQQEKPTHLALRTAEFKYVEYASGERELYDLAADPWELRNRASRLTPSKVRRLSSALRGLAGCAGEECRQAEERELPAP